MFQELSVKAPTRKYRFYFKQLASTLFELRDAERVQQKIKYIIMLDEWSLTVCISPA